MISWSATLDAVAEEVTEVVGERMVRARVADDDRRLGPLPRADEDLLRWSSSRLDGIMLDSDATGEPGLMSVARRMRPGWRPGIAPGALEMIERSYVSLFTREPARGEIICLLTGSPVLFSGSTEHMVPVGAGVWEIRVTVGHGVVHGLRPGVAYPLEVAGWLDEVRTPGWSVVRPQCLSTLRRARRAWVRQGRRGVMPNPFQFSG